jgi:hypothetical protein
VAIAATIVVAVTIAIAAMMMGGGDRMAFRRGGDIAFA